MPEFPHPILRRKSSVESDSSDNTSETSSVSERSVSERSVSERCLMKRVSFSEKTATFNMMSEEEYDRKSVPISRLYYKDYCELRMMRMQMTPDAYNFEC